MQYQILFLEDLKNVIIKASRHLSRTLMSGSVEYKAGIFITDRFVHTPPESGDHPSVRRLVMRQGGELGTEHIIFRF